MNKTKITKALKMVTYLTRKLEEAERLALTPKEGLTKAERKALKEDKRKTLMLANAAASYIETRLK